MAIQTSAGIVARLRELNARAEPDYAELRAAAWYVFWSVLWNPARSVNYAWMAGHETQWRLGVGMVGLFGLFAWWRCSLRVRAVAMSLPSLLSAYLTAGFLANGVLLAAALYSVGFAAPSLLAVIALRRRWNNGGTPCL